MVSMEVVEMLEHGMGEGCPAGWLANDVGHEDEGGHTNCDRGW